MNEKINKYQMCSRCIMDTKDDPDIAFDEGGVCTHCVIYDGISQARKALADKREPSLAALLDRIKGAGRKQEYDCVVGVSGGVDSTYVAYLAKQFGLRTLAVHCDNGWNSELAVKNIENIVKKLDFDLYTHVINWEEFRDLQLSYLKASVVDIEAVTDHAIIATLYQVAAQNKIKYILSGENMATEGLLPQHWVHNKNDLINIKAIHRRFGNIPLKTYPTLGFRKNLFYQRLLGLNYVTILDYVDYVKEEAKEIILEELGWRDYGGKHYESIFTRFYQSYILPTKFHIDKRKSHLSTLVCSGQMTREMALEKIKEQIIDNDVLSADREYVIKKFGLTNHSFDAIMALPVKQHTDYPSILNVYRRLRPAYRKIKPIFKLTTEIQRGSFDRAP